MPQKEKKIEELFDELEALVNEIENDVMPLEKMVDRVTYGAKLIRQCRSRLNVLNNKVEIMFKDDGKSGEFTEFDLSSERAQATGSNEQKTPEKTNQKLQDDLPF